MNSMEDPFVASTEEQTVSHDPQRYSTFDTQLFSLNASSPAQAKRALEAHLAETERRLEEASKLGTTLIEQQRELEEKLREVEQQQDEDQIGSDLRQKLADLEREYNEIGRETARAFLAPKRHVGGEEGHLSTTSIDQKSPLSPVLFASQATNSPSKVSVPSRKQRNQPSSRVHDIEFATEISTSLLAQVRQLQSLLAEREESLKNVMLEKSQLEMEAEGYAQRIRALDESEERYKDENWTLETRTHELMSAIKEAADREHRLNGSLGAVTSEKNAVERELEELKQTNAKLIEEQATTQKANDAEIHLLRRNLNTGDTERLALQKKVEELNTQNEELAKVVATRLRQFEAQATLEVPRDNHPSDDDQATPENSPPPSPNKFTPRHGHLETETLRSSLGHAHRMIQNLKSTIHREKTEKIELKRMLQEARDDIEQRRREAAAPTGPSTKRQKTKPDASRKPARPDLLGAGRRGKTEIEIEDTDWEDNAPEATPTRNAVASLVRNRSAERSSEEPSDAYHTATEADDAFETANERETATESEAFQTSIETMAGDSSDTDELTETEDSVLRTPRQRVSSSLVMAKARDRSSYQSTASTSADEDEDDTDGGFPSPSQTSTPRYRLRKKRSVLRKIRPSGEAPMAYSSRPSSARESAATSFAQDSASMEGQSLFAELAELEGGEDEDGAFDTQSQTSTPRMLPTPDSRRPSEVILEVPVKPAMVDSGVMTDPWEPTGSVGDVIAVQNAVPVAPSTPTRETALDAESHVNVKAPPRLVNSATQWTPLKSNGEPNGDQISSVPTPPKMAWDDASDAERELVNHTAPSPAQLDVSSISSQETSPVAASFPELSTSYFVGSATEPVALPASKPWEMTLSNVSSQTTEPMMVQLPEPEPVYVPQMVMSAVFAEHTAPIAASIPEPEPVPVISVADHATSTDLPELDVSTILSESTQPIAAMLPEPEPIIIPPVADQSTSTDVAELGISLIWSEQTEPIAVSLPISEPEPVLVVEEPAQPELPELDISDIHSTCTEPVAPQIREVPVPAPVLPDLTYSAIRSVETLPIEHILPMPITVPLQATDRSIYPAEPQDTAVATQPEDNFASTKDVAGENARPSTRERETGSGMPLGVISGNAVNRDRRQQTSQADSGAQTILSSKQIDQILMERVSSRPLSPPDSDKAKDSGPSPFATPKARPRPTQHSSTASLQSVQRRPGSSASVSSSINSHPPLPADHREAILAAEKKSLEQRPVSPSVMGPPMASASALRASSIQRPRTPNEVGVVHSTRTSVSRSKIGRESQMSRASSVSSFASEIEERFNVNAYANPMANGYAAGTDPRMIQAITQTMIGEFLWKYTRRTVTGEISNTRHRRYFWVHPYTRTLYWSEQDPQSAGKSEVRTKSVPIEAVRVVADDNPYPPGLHCRSLEVVSPGRRVRFTASTSQRHETWFNALSYLLLRNADENEEVQEQEPNAALADIDEFNSGFRSSSRQTARISFSSSRSRTVRNVPKQRAGSAMSVRQTVPSGRVSPAPSAPSQISNLQVPDDGRHGSTSRLSTILNTTIKGSFGRRGRPSYSTSSVNEGSVHEGSLHDRDSEEDFRRMMEREQESDRLENVRACCDGKHDVSSLARTSRYSPRANRIHSHH